jgi:hypothetical protein
MVHLVYLVCFVLSSKKTRQTKQTYLTSFLGTLLLTPPAVNWLHVARDKWMRDPRYPESRIPNFESRFSRQSRPSRS